MSFERFIAQRFMPRRGGGFSGPLTRVAVVGIALGVVVMIMAVSILRGFRGDITGKVVGFGSHVTVHSYVDGTAIADSAVRSRVERLRGVRKVQAYATKGGMVKTDDQIYGIMFRGLEEGYDTTFFAACLIEGQLPATANDVLVSQTIASKLGLHTGDKMRTYFWQDDNYRARAFNICGLYRTDLTEMDEVYVIGDRKSVV